VKKCNTNSCLVLSSWFVTPASVDLKTSSNNVRCLYVQMKSLLFNRFTCFLSFPFPQNITVTAMLLFNFNSSINRDSRLAAYSIFNIGFHLANESSARSPGGGQYEGRLLSGQRVKTMLIIGCMKKHVNVWGILMSIHNYDRLSARQCDCVLVVVTSPACQC
jgi:hypothetical protein